MNTTMPFKFPCACRAMIASLANVIMIAMLFAPFMSKANDQALARPSSSLRLAVPRSLAVAGQEQALVGRIEYSGEVEQTVKISFLCHKARMEEKMTCSVEEGRLKTLSTKCLQVLRTWYRRLTGREKLLSVKCLRLIPGKKEIVAKAVWTPDETGEFTIVARLKPARPDKWNGPLEVAQPVTVVQRTLHFHYWGVNTNLKYITEGMVNNAAELDYWADRGVIAQRWAGGLCELKGKKKPTLDEMAGWWVARHRKQGWPGIVIDEFGEFGGGNERDQFLGLALLQAKDMEPDNYIAAYCCSVGGGLMADGLGQAVNRVLVETYESSAAYGYDRIRNRYQSALNHGLADKTLAALAFSGWITTPQELRRQLHFTRYTFPDMPGIAFFGRSKGISNVQVNEHIRRFYIEPVLRVEILDDNRVQITNIGGRDAPATRIKFYSENDGAMRAELAVPPLKVGRKHTAPAPGKSLQPQTDYSGDVLVLGPPLLWDKEPPEFRSHATNKWPAAESIVSNVKENFEKEPELDFQRDQSNKIVAAYYSLQSTDGRSFEMSFDLEIIRAWYYGRIAIGLTNTAGKSSLTLSLRRGDHQPGQHFNLSLQNEEGIAAHEHIAQIICYPIRSGKYRVVTRYDEPEGCVRAAIYDDSGLKLWDTGRVPTYGKMSFDRLVFGVNSGDVCNIAWNKGRKAMFLRGGGGPYILAGLVNSFEMSVYAAGTE